VDKDLPFVQHNLQPLASGGFGTVLSGRHRVTQAPIVVKITQMTEDEDDNEALWDAFEAEVDFYDLMTIRRPAVSWMPRYYGSGMMRYHGAKSPWIALERLRGCLRSLTLSGEAASEFRHLVLGALDALEGFHAEGYVHRDVKLENFAVRKDPTSGKSEVCLIDFGLLVEYATTEPEDDYQTYTGTQEFSSDRQLKEQMVGPADDLESLGYTILHLYMGESWV
jgi:serine/threonine protein kinase